MPYMPTVRCPKCGTEFSAMQSKCPTCGNRRTMETDKDFVIKPDPEPVPEPAAPAEAPAAKKAPIWPRALGVLLIVLGLMCGALAVYTHLHPPFVPLPAATATPEPTPVPTPTPTPTVQDLHLYYLDRDLGTGFTAYVGEAALTLTAVATPDVGDRAFTWSVSDPESAKLSVSQDTRTCTYTALKPSGKNELTVRCYGLQLTIPVYLWNRD